MAFLAVFLSSFVMAAISAGLTKPFLNRHFQFNVNLLFLNLLVCIQQLESFVDVCQSDHFILQFSGGELLVAVPAIKSSQLTSPGQAQHLNISPVRQAENTLYLLPVGKNSSRFQDRNVVFDVDLGKHIRQIVKFVIQPFRQH